MDRDILVDAIRAAILEARQAALEALDVEEASFYTGVVAGLRTCAVLLGEVCE